MGRALYFECGTGISGDMTVAALLDLGADRAALDRMLNSLPLEGFRVEISRVRKAGLDACDFNVILEHETHDHDMEYLYGHERGQSVQEAGEREHEHHHHHEHEHEGEHHHHHHSHEHEEHEHKEHGHEAHEHHHGHEHRGLPEILDLLRHADMTPGALALAERIFRVLAEAEAKAHGVPVEEVHFHEVGAADSIIDIASAAVCLDSLSVEACVIPCLCEGTGSVRCQHGILPVPVPAVLNIVQAAGLPLQILPVRGELVTPTGAAIAAAVRTAGELPPRFRVLKTGIGAGKREYERPSLLRVLLIEEEEPTGTRAEADGTVVQEDTVVQLEANLDDCTGEVLGYTMERLLSAGARDVWYTPVYMKKNRPGTVLGVLCAEDRRRALEEIIFTETTALGIRRTEVRRTILPRETVTEKTAFGDIQVKRWTGPSGERYAPEYESAAAVAREQGLPLSDVTARIRRELDGRADGTR